MSAERTSSSERGAWAEDMALAFMIKQGLREVARNYRCRHGEIDLILNDADTLVFAEVRYRAVGALVSATQSISHAKQRRLLASAEHYLQRRDESNTRECRFDVLAVSGNAPNPTVQWLRDAFEAQA